MQKTIDHHTYNTKKSELIAQNKSDVGKRGDLDYKDLRLYRTKRGRLFIHNANARTADKDYIYCGLDEIYPVSTYFSTIKDDGKEWWIAEVPHKHYYKGQVFTGYDYYDFIIDNQ